MPTPEPTREVRVTYCDCWTRGGGATCKACAPQETPEGEPSETNVRNAALEEAARIADEHWPEAGHVPQHDAVSCAMSISVQIRRLKSTPPAAVECESCAEYDTLMTRLSSLLTGTANALKGEPAPLSQHDWSDLPAVAATHTRSLAALREVADEWQRNEKLNSVDAMRRVCAALSEREP